MTTLAPEDLAALGVWADAQPDTARVGVQTLRAVLATLRGLNRELRQARRERDAAWALLAADLTPPDSETP
jgi:hypothetical protein